MNVFADRKRPDIELNQAEVQLAIAYIADEPVAEMLKKNLSGNLSIRRYQLVNYREEFPDSTIEELDSLLEQDIPSLYSYKMPFKYKASLFGAFALAIDHGIPRRPAEISMFTTDEIIATASSGVLALSVH